MAEGYFQSQLSNSQIKVMSAGLSALVNFPADHNAQEVMLRKGIDISKHRAQQITEDLIRKANLILVMTQSQLETLARQFIIAKGKTFLLGSWRRFEIQDPYAQNYENFEKVYQQIELGWQDWQTRILPCQISV